MALSLPPLLSRGANKGCVLIGTSYASVVFRQDNGIAGPPLADQGTDLLYHRCLCSQQTEIETIPNSGTSGIVPELNAMKLFRKLRDILKR